MRMISLVVAMIGVMCVIAPEAKAQWCSIDHRIGAENCGFATFGQCRAYISGIGGHCYRSPWYYAAPRPAYRYPYRVRRYYR